MFRVFLLLSGLLFHLVVIASCRSTREADKQLKASPESSLEKV